MTEGYTGADLASIANAAAVLAIKQQLKLKGKEAESSSESLTITMRDFEEAIASMKRRRETAAGE
jgi:SpoVK/Ycf46/Vps4 family AAA+-type ATPase